MHKAPPQLHMHERSDATHEQAHRVETLHVWRHDAPLLHSTLVVLLGHLVALIRSCVGITSNKGHHKRVS